MKKFIFAATFIFIALCASQLVLTQKLYQYHVELTKLLTTSLQITQKIETLYSAIKDADQRYNNYLKAAPVTSLANFDASLSRIQQIHQSLQLVIAQPALSNHSKAITKLLNHKIQFYKNSIALHDSGKIAETVTMTNGPDGRALTNQIYAQMVLLMRQAQDLPLVFNDANQHNIHSVLLALIGIALGACVLLVLLLLILLRHLKKLAAASPSATQEADAARYTQLQTTFKQLQEKNALIDMLTQQGILDWDIATGHLIFSEKLSEILQLEPHETPKNMQDYTDRLHPQDQKSFTKLLDAHLNNHQPYTLEFQIKKGNGKYIWCNTIGQATWNTEHQATRMVIVIRDITREKIQKEERHVLIHKTVEDLRANLTAIEGALGLVIGGATGEISQNTKQLLDIAQKNYQHVLQIIMHLESQKILE